MHSPFVNHRKQQLMPEILHVKRKSLDRTPEKQLIIKPVKIAVKLPDTRSRSLSANNKFRNMFQIPNPKKKQKKSFVRNLNEDSPLDASKYSQMKYLNEISSIVSKESKNFRIKFKENCSGDVEKVISRPVVPRIRFPGVLDSPAKEESGVLSNLVTFRPDLTPPKKQFRFPRDVFTTETRRRV